MDIILKVPILPLFDISTPEERFLKLVLKRIFVISLGEGNLGRTNNMNKSTWISELPNGSIQFKSERSANDKLFSKATMMAAKYSISSPIIFRIEISMTSPWSCLDEHSKSKRVNFGMTSSINLEFKWRTLKILIILVIRSSFLSKFVNDFAIVVWNMVQKRPL